MNHVLQLTLQQYDRMVAKGAFDEVDQKIELIRGAICVMNPAGPVHDDIIDYLYDWSVRSTKRKEIHIRGQSGMALPEQESRPEPDIFWVKARRYLDGHPTGSDTLLAIEVADSSLKTDRTVKAELYAEAGVDEYWIVDVVGQCVHVLREIGDDGTYSQQRSFGLGQTISPIAKASAELDISDLFGVGQ